MAQSVPGLKLLWPNVAYQNQIQIAILGQIHTFGTETDREGGTVARCSRRQGTRLKRFFRMRVALSVMVACSNDSNAGGDGG